MAFKTQTLCILVLIRTCLVILFHILHVSGCGRVNISRPLIQNGNAALRGEWPFIAALHRVYESKYFCGGTIITNQHVLTGNNDFLAYMLNPLKPKQIF